MLAAELLVVEPLVVSDDEPQPNSIGTASSRSAREPCRRCRAVAADRRFSAGSRGKRSNRIGACSSMWRGDATLRESYLFAFAASIREMAASSVPNNDSLGAVSMTGSGPLGPGFPGAPDNP